MNDTHDAAQNSEQNLSQNPSSFKSRLQEGLWLQELENFSFATLQIESQALRGNPLGDPTLRRNPVLVPRAQAPAQGWPVVFVLSGLTGNGTYSFGQKYRAPNTAETLDLACKRGEAPLAIYVFCDAMTYWGGSQFINSEGTGRYEDFVLNELVEAVKRECAVTNDRQKWCVSGGSSGGYGALHLATKRPDVFGFAAAIAPDSFFEASLLPDLYTALPVLTSLGGINAVRREMEAGRWMKRKEAFPVLNAIAMGLCYAPSSDGTIEYPLDAETGILKPETWSKWKRHDPVEFIKERSESAARLDMIYLDVGTRDQFQLLFGTRQIRDRFHDLRVSCDYSEFEGTHFDIGERRSNFWKWLKQNWS